MGTPTNFHSKLDRIPLAITKRLATSEFKIECIVVIIKKLHVYDNHSVMSINVKLLDLYMSSYMTLADTRMLRMSIHPKQTRLMRNS